MQTNSLKRSFILTVLLITLTQAAIISNPTPTKQTVVAQNAVFFTTVTKVTDLSRSASILSQLAVPGFSRKHGYNYVALDGWSCNRTHGPVISIWKNPNQYLNATLAANDSESRKIIKQFYQASGVKVLVSAFGSYENPVTDKLDAADCANKLIDFIEAFGLDGANIDFQDTSSFQNDGISWLTKFTLALTSNNNSHYIFSHSVDVSLFDQSQYPTGDYSLIEKAVGRYINFYNIRYYGPKSSFTTFKQIFTMGTLSVSSLSQSGIALSKIVIGKPSLYNATGYVLPGKLIQYYRKANAQIAWWGGAMFSPYIDQEAEDETRFVTLRRDNIQPISATNLDSVNFWWPPEKTAVDIGVPGYAPNNMYNTFIFGVWTCQAGAFDISKLWSQASLYLSTTFGNTTQATQAFLKERYESKGKNILVRAFGTAESPTSASFDPATCARGLSNFVKNNNLDGVDINYQDNIAFNNGIAENWLISFTNALRSLMPFHIISHSVQDYLLDRTKYTGGSYTRVISTIGNLLDFYSINYYGQQHTTFTTYQQLFENSGTEFSNISVTQLVQIGFDIEKLVVGKPVRLYDAQGAGFIEAQKLRQIFLQASGLLNWRGGLSYSSYINDQNGASIMMVLRGINRTDSKRFVYVDNVNIWWPPQSTLAQMGVPTLAASNIYNYFAYSFWTCGHGPQGISKLYNDPVTYLGTELGKNKIEIQTYIKGLYASASVKLLISAFGASQFPVNQSLSAVTCGNKMAQFMGNNLIDGIDIDFQDSLSFKDGIGQQWVNVFMRQIRKSKPFHIITHAPQGPYFNKKFSQTGSYQTINKVSGKYIDFYNIQFYNQGNTTYTTYQGLFIDSGTQNSNTSVFQIINQGIQPEKVVLGKPVTNADAYNTGYVSSSTLKNLLKQAVKDPNNPGWTPSVMYWQYLSDLNGSNIAETMSYKS